MPTTFNVITRLPLRPATGTVFRCVCCVFVGVLVRLSVSESVDPSGKNGPIFSGRPKEFQNGTRNAHYIFDLERSKVKVKDAKIAKNLYRFWP